VDEKKITEEDEKECGSQAVPINVLASVSLYQLELVYCTSQRADSKTHKWKANKPTLLKNSLEYFSEDVHRTESQIKDWENKTSDERPRSFY